MKNLIFRLLIILLLLITKASFAQVPTNINSGNPAFPFPQFLDYGPDRKSLASHNAPGMTHAEMEMRMRQAYTHMCNAMSFTGEQVSGIKYIIQGTKLNSLSPGGDPCTCAEADGYYLLAAAYMGDKKTYDGLYMQMHDRSVRRVKRFIDGVVNAPDWGYSTGGNGAGNKTSPTGTLGTAANWGEGAATDGDEDIALAMLVAYMQWGEKSGIILNGNGWVNHEINYKEEARFFIGAMADTVFATHKAGDLPHGRKYYNTGLIGLDGYFKDGDKQSDLTDWFKNGISNYKGVQYYDKVGPANSAYVDYHSPAYVHQFAKWFEKEGYSPWCSNQFKRAAASSDWLTGLHYSKSPKNIPFAGFVNVVPNSNNLDFTFTDMNPGGEDFRWAWRTITNYMWHGNPTYTWDPVKHEVIENKPNTYQRDMGVRYAKFLMNQQDGPWNNPCRNIGDLNDLARTKKITFKGTYTVVNGYLSDGTVQGSFPIPQTLGAGSSSAIAAQDFELMGEIFRHCASVWDGTPRDATNQTATYFHEWFKLLGLLTVSGNFHAPDNMIARPNLKVYHKVDKTFGFTGDKMTFTVTYRNYGSVDAAGTVVKFGIPKGFEFVSSTIGTLSGDSVVWNVGTAKGLKDAKISSTIDSMKITLKVGPTASGRYCTSARISCTNGFGWVSDEYPNNITTVMERNCVDIVKRALRVEKTASRKQVNPATNGDVVYKIKFENSSDAGWINGGRPGVRLAFAHEDLATPAAAAANVLKFRLFHDAAEPYIDYGNYRVSYFMNDKNIKGYSSAGGTPTWGIENTIAEGVDKNLVKVFHEQIVPGSDANGSWNQRIVLQFSPQVATITQHLQQYAGSPDKVHEGGTAALRGVWRLFTNNYIDVDWTDDWSWDPTFKDGDGGIYYPIGDDYTNPEKLGLPINSWHRSACQTTNQIVKRVLVEEWDGYVWRRILGNGPSPGRDIPDVVVSDTLPKGVTFKNFIRKTALGVTATTSTLPDGRTLIRWTIPKMQVNQKDSLVYTATITGTCPGSDRLVINTAWIEGSSESAISESDTVTVTCNEVTICPEPTTLTKTSDKLTYAVNDPVIYTIKYTQTQGSIANPDLSTSVDWTKISGADATFADGKIMLQGGAKTVITHDYSYGTNTLGDGIEGTIQVAASEGDFSIVVRDDIYITLKPVGGSNPTYVDIYSGTNKLNPTSFSVPFSVTSYDFRIKLNAGTLSMWLVSTGTEINGAAPIVQTGIPVKAGNAGFAHGMTGNNPYASHTITSWRTHLDAAFNVEITDPVPAGIISPTAISNPGTNNAGVITWKLATGKSPLLFGTKQDLTWKGVYNTCKKVTNVAYINTRGITGNQFGVCYDINCANAVCTLKGGKIGTSRTICYNTAPPAFTEIAPATGGNNYNYIWQSSADLTKWTDLPNTNSPAYTSTSLTDTTYLRRKVSSTSCTDAYSDTITITVLPQVLAPAIAADQIICTGKPALPITITTAPSGGNGNFIRQWQQSANNITFTDISTAASESYDPGTISSPIWYRLKVTSGSCAAVTSEPVKITLNPSIPVTVSINDPGAVCSGQPVTFTATPVAAGLDPSYRWYKNDGKLTNDTLAVYTTTSIADGDRIRAEVISRLSCATPKPAVSNEVKMKVTAVVVPTVSINDPGVICSGQKAVFTATPVNGGTPAYQWFINSKPLQAETLANFSSQILKNGDTVNVEMTSSLSCSGTKPAVSEKVVMKITSLAEASVSINIPGPQCTGKPVKFIATPVNGDVPAYVWYLNDKPVPDETSEEFISTSFINGDIVQVEMTSGSSCASPKPAVSKKVAVTIKPITSPAVSIQPTATTICAGDLVAFNIKSIQGEGSKPEYKWLVNDASEVGDTMNTFSSSTLANNSKIKLQITSSEQCSVPTVAESEEITIIHSTSVDPSVSIAVTGGDTSLCEGELPVIEVISTPGGGSNPAFQWILNDNEIPKANGKKYTPSAVTDKDKYSVVMTTSSSCANSPTAFSNDLIFSVKDKVTPSVKISVTPEASFCRGDELQFTIDSEENQGKGPIYQWLKNDEVIEDAKGITFISSTLNNNDKISLRLTSNESCLTKETVISDGITLKENSTPAAEITALSNTFCAYDALQLNTPSIPAGADYEWFLDNKSIPGAVFSSYKTKVPGDYKVKVTTTEGCDSVSAVFSVSKIPAKAVSVRNKSTVTCPNQAPTLASSIHDPRFSYLWIDENDEIVHRNDSIFTPSSSGSYRVVVNSGTCSDTSSAYVVTIESLNIPEITGPSNPICESKGITFSVLDPQPGSVYNWSVPDNAKIISGNGTEKIVVDFGTSNGKVIVAEMLTSTCRGLSDEINIQLTKCDFMADFSSAKTEICAGESVTFTNDSKGTSDFTTTYLWDFGNGTTSEEKDPAPVVYNKKGMYTVKLTITDEISKPITKTNFVTVNAAENITAIEGPSESCLNGQATFTATPYTGYTYTWNVTNGHQLKSNGNAANITFTTSETAEISLTYKSKENCPGSILSKSVPVKPAPTVTLSSASTHICPNGKTTIIATGGAAGTTYIWSKDKRILAGSGNSSIGVNDEGAYWATLKNANCTYNSDTIKITKSRLIADAGPDQIIESGNAAELNVTANVPVKSYAWRPAGTAPVQNPTVKPAATTSYIVIITDLQGCTASDTVDVKVITPLFIPNAFTPNGDGIHDEWVIKGTERVDNFSYQIFNRWGNIVYSSAGQQDWWNGTHNGEVLPVATYYYVIKYKVYGEEKTEAGSVLLSK